MSDIIESCRADMIEMFEIGAIDKVTLREFNEKYPPTVRDMSAMDIRKLRESLNCSQAVFARFLNTSASTIRKWEQSETQPSGPALKLLNVLADKGLRGIV